MTDRAAASARRITADKVGILIGVLTIVAVLGLPFAVLRPNRIAAGTDLSVFAALPALQGAAFAALWIVGALWAMTASRPAWRLAAGCAWLATLAYAVGAAATHLVAPTTRSPAYRPPPASGCCCSRGPCSSRMRSHGSPSARGGASPRSSSR